MRGARVAVLALLGALAVSSCSSDSNQGDVNIPYKSDIDQLLAGPLSDFERQVLEDYVITDEEHQEARELYARCLRDRGLTVTLLPDGGDIVTGPDASEEVISAMGVALTECVEGTIGIVQGYFHEMKSNPQKGDYSTLIADCLVRVGVVEPGFTGADYYEEIEKQQPVFDMEAPLFFACNDSPTTTGVE